MSNHRAERVSDKIRQIVSRLLQGEIRDPRIGFVTVTDVSVSQDLKNARVFVSVLGDDPEGSIEALQRATPFVRRALGREAGLRYTPSLHFVRDDTAERGARLDQLLETARSADESDDEKLP